MIKKRPIEFDFSDEHQDGDTLFNEVFEMRFMDSKAKFEWNMYMYVTFGILGIALILNVIFPEYMYFILAGASILMIYCYYLNNKKRLKLIADKRICKVRLKNKDRNVDGYTKIKAKNALTIMNEKCLIIDASITDYYNEMHVKNAVSIPLEELEEKIATMNISQNETILVYSRSVERSEQAAQKLVDLGYTDVYSFGSIMDWPYDVVLQENED